MTKQSDTEEGLAAAAAPQSRSITSGRFSEDSVLVFRSNAAAAAKESWDEDLSTTKVATAVDLHDDDDEKEDDNDPVTLPESTHTLLFTEPINSKPFVGGFLIAGMSILCLLLALLDNPWSNLKDSIPANVKPTVKVAQFCSIFIALVMEEEIPTALFLLRRIPRQYFQSKFPELK